MPTKSLRKSKLTLSHHASLIESVGKKKRVATKDVDRIEIIANRYIVQNFPFGCLAGRPRHLSLGTNELWIVPITLTSAGHGAVGEVGILALDSQTRKVVGGTPSEEVAAAIKRLKREKHNELDAAFHRARKG